MIKLKRDRPDFLRRAVRCLVPILGTLQLSCATSADVLRIEPVRPWERGVLAGDDMQLINDAMDQAVDDHIYFSREDSIGGAVSQGGGCGCN